MKKSKSFLLLLLFLSSMFCILFFVQDAAVFRPSHDADSYGYLTARPDFEKVVFSSNGKTRYGILRRNGSSKPSPLILFFYGNAQNASGTMRSMETLKIWPYFLDYNCLIVDYTGYGIDSKSKASSKNMYEDALAAFDYARALPDCDRIIAGGFSIGTGPATYLAAHRDTAGLFLLAPYANGYDLCNNVVPIFHGPMRLLVKHPFPSDKYAEKVDIPVLLVASRDDKTIPFSSSQRLDKRFGGETSFIILSGVRHNEILFNRTALESIKLYLEMLAANW